MIGILAKLAKAAKLAQTAEAAIDVASNKLGPKEGGGTGSDPSGEGDPSPSGDGESVAPPEKSEFDLQIEAGVPDPRKLLSASDVESIIGKRVRGVSVVGTDDCLVCDYLCKDRSGTVLGLHVTKTMPWEGFDTEIEKKEIFDDLGEAAFRGGRQIYVRAGDDLVFWIHTAGEVMVDMAVRAARLVLGRL